MAPGEGRKRLCSDKDPHGGERVRHVDQGAVSGEARCVPETDRNDKSSHAGMKGEFVGKSVPLDGNCQTEKIKLDRTDPEGIRPNPMKNRKQGLIRKYVPMRMLRLYL